VSTNLVYEENPDTILTVDNANLDTQLTPTIVITHTIKDEGGVGPQGEGVPVGGLAGDVLVKIDSTNFNTQWLAPSYNYVKTLPSTTWTIAHNLGRKPIVMTYTTGGVSLIGTVTNLSNNVLEISFSASVAGTARLI
jgi:hypothetical protein